MYLPADGGADPGWGHKPTEWSKTLKGLIRERQSACRVDGANFGRKGRAVQDNMDCTPWGAKMLAEMMTSPDPLKPMPEPRRLSLPLLHGDAKSDPGEYLVRFMQEIGAGGERSIYVEPVSGYRLLVDDKMFTDHKTGEMKITKEQRHRYLLYLAEAVLRPDEVWLKTSGHGDQTLFHLARFVISRKPTALIAVFKKAGAVWQGWSGYQSESAVYLQSKRAGELLYRRP